MQQSEPCQQSAFSLIEILIVVAIFSLLTIAILSVLKPIELINRARDSAMLNTASEISQAADRYLAQNNQAIFAQQVNGVPLDEDPAQKLVTTLVQQGEVRTSFAKINAQKLANLYLSASPGLQQKTLCFQPRSQAFQQQTETIFDKSGFTTDCQDQTCYYCLNSRLESGGQASAETNTEVTSETEDENCQDFNPEQPSFPWTCNYSDKWEQYGCSQFCVVDNGCDDYCPPGQRHLQLSYYGTGDNSGTCLLKMQETQEHYCVSDPYARCDLMSLSSSPNDFAWGCSNPRRPIGWLTE